MSNLTLYKLHQEWNKYIVSQSKTLFYVTIINLMIYGTNMKKYGSFYCYNAENNDFLHNCLQ